MPSPTEQVAARRQPGQKPKWMTGTLTRKKKG
jgi:hypothetical protein